MKMNRTGIATLALALVAGGLGLAAPGGQGSKAPTPSAVLGAVASVDGEHTSFVVQPEDAEQSPVQVVTNAQTQFLKSDCSNATFRDVVKDLDVAVTGSPSADGALLAQRVLLRAAPDRSASGAREVTGSGTVSNVEAGTGAFVVQPQRSDAAPFTVTTTAETEFRKSDGTKAALADVKESVEVCVLGVQTGLDSLAAKRVLILVTPAASTGKQRRMER